MSDQTDSGQEARTSEGTQPQSNSQPTDDSKTLAGNSLAGAALADALLSDDEAREIVRRKLQSEKDRGVKQAVKKADAVQDQLEAFAKAMGVDLTKVSEFRRNKMLDELYQERYGDSQPNVGGQEEAEAQQAASSVDISKVKAAYPELDFNDNEVLAAISKFPTDKAGLLAALGEIKIQKAGKPQASPTQDIQPGGTAVKPVGEKEALTSAYKSDLEALKKANGGSVTPMALETLKSDYRKKGLEIY